MQEKILLVNKIKERVVSCDDGAGVAREMCPKFLIVWAQYRLVNSLLNNLALDQGWEGQKH